VIDQGLVAELKEAVTALMVIVIVASVYGGVKSKEIEGVLSIAFVFSSVFAVALWATAMLGLNLASAANTVVFYIAVIWTGIVIVLLILTLGFVVSAIIAFSEVLELRSFIGDVRRCVRGETGLWFPIVIARGIASVLKEEIRELFTIAYIYSIATAAYGLYLVFLAR